MTSALLCLLLACSAASEAEGLKIENQQLAVTCRAEMGEFSVRTISSEHAFLQGHLSAAGGTARGVELEIAPFGKAPAIQIQYPGGNRDEIVLVGDLPFVLFRSTVHNSGSEATTIQKLRTLDVRLDLGRPAEGLRVQGTGGLKSPKDAQGSYLWTAVADPLNRHGVVVGWIGADRGSGVILPSVEEGQVRLEAQLDYGRLRIEPGESAVLETLAIGWFDDARLGLEAYADAIARRLAIKLPPQPCGYCTWYHAGASNEKQLAQQSEFVAKHLAPYGLSVMQIDDGWQDGNCQGNGPNKNFTRHRPDGPFPSGMKATADRIRELGLVPGLWFMPFAGTHNDPWYADKQAWFVHRADDGKPYDTPWGGTCLDMTHPDTRGYLRKTVDEIAHTWGYRYFKMDGLYTGTGTPQIYINDAYRPDGIGDAVFHNPDKTNLEAYRDGLKLVRETAGPEVFILGCCIPQNMRSYGGAMGLIDAMRIGPDNGADSNGLLTGPDYGSRHYFLHGRVWYNDPDPVYVRPSLPLEQARLSCSWAAIAGQLTIGSDDFQAMPAERLDILKRVMPAHGATARPVDLFDRPLPQIWQVTDSHGGVRRDVVGLFNWSADAPLTIDCPLARLGLPEAEYSAFDFWAGAALPTMKEKLHVLVPPRSCMIVALRPVANHPQLLSTSRHVTQGIVDSLQETWDAAARTLSGVSRVVGDDPYELRLTLPADCHAASAEVSPDDRAAGANISTKEEPGLARVTVRSRASRDVRWTVRFTAAQ